MLCLSMNWLSLIYAICFEHIHLYCSLKRQAVHLCAQMLFCVAKCLLGGAQTPCVLHPMDAGCAFLRNASAACQCTLSPKIPNAFWCKRQWHSPGIRGIIKTEEAGTLDFSGVPAFFVTTVLIVQCSAAYNVHRIEPYLISSTVAFSSSKVL